MTPGTAMMTVWSVWMLSWIAAAPWSARSAKRAGRGRDLASRGLVFVGAVLAFAVDWAPGGLGYRLYPAPAGLGWVPVALVVLGLLFTWWARLHLGVMWSGGIDRKEHHRIVDTGPYRLVRHPIYTGLILAIIATAAAARTPTVFAGVAVMVAGFVMKARFEEKFLRDQLGREAYDAYALRVPMLVPFWPPAV
jgi:protein-S-isoprenylcysteine O-methyltransferase Ste14